MNNQIKMPDGLEYWTCDKVAECLPYQQYIPGKQEQRELYRKLWSFLEESENPTPLGGDGSNGTVETPDGRLALDNHDKANQWWFKLTNIEAVAISRAYKEEFINV